MSEEQINKLLNRIDAMLLKLEHIESRLLKQSLPEKDEWDEKKMPFYIGQALSFLFPLQRNNTPEQNRAYYEELYLHRKEIFSMIKKKAEKIISARATEAEKLAILQQEGG